MKSHAKVLQVHHFRFPKIRGGVDRVVAELAVALCPQHCALFEVGEWTERGLKRRVESGITVYRRRLVFPWDARGVLRKLYATAEMLIILWQLSRLIRREHIEIVHLHTLQDYHVYFRILAQLGVCPYLITLHGSETLAYPVRSREQKRRWADELAASSKVVAVSATQANIATANLPMKEPPSVVLNGITDPMTDNIRQELRPEGIPYALCVGALVDSKGHSVAIDAWSILRSLGVEIELRIAGDGSLREVLGKRVAERGVTDRVHFLGALPHSGVMGQMSNAAMYIMPSINEGLGLALLEAAALARPIIASDIPVFHEIIEDGRSGKFFPVGDAQALAASVIALLEDAEIARAMGAEARQRFLTAFGSKRMAADYQKIYDSVIVFPNRLHVDEAMK